MRSKHNIPPIKLPVDDGSLLEEQIRLNTIRNKIKNMGLHEVEEIFAKFDVEPEWLIYRPHFIINNRPIINVVEIKERGKPRQIINHKFYRSSGQSRGTGLNDVWMPTTGISPGGYHIEKPEDYWLIFDIPEDIQEGINNYGRFVKRELALVSYFLHVLGDKLQLDMPDGQAPQGNEVKIQYGGQIVMDRLINAINGYTYKDGGLNLSQLKLLYRDMIGGPVPRNRKSLLDHFSTTLSHKS
jgi:hypothetical protein